MQTIKVSNTTGNKGERFTKLVENALLKKFNHVDCLTVHLRWNTMKCTTLMNSRKVIWGWQAPQLPRAEKAPIQNHEKTLCSSDKIHDVCRVT